MCIFYCTDYTSTLTLILKWYKKSSSFNFHIRVNEKLSPNTYTFDFYEENILPERPEAVPAAACLAGDVDEDAWLTEHSIALKSYGVVLSLLWIHEENTIGI